MAMEITSNYGSYAVQSMAGNNASSSTKKKEAESTSETSGAASQKAHLIMRMNWQNLPQV